ncbi:copper chaperone PCu(A)C [Halovulum sp. GXIMD14793]
MKTTILAAGALALGLVSATFADTFTAGDIEIRDAYAFATPPKAMNGAAYMEIANTGETADRLIEARSDAGRTELHKSEKNAEGAMAMIHQKDGIAIPAGEAVSLQPGGYHIMFMGLDGPFVEGQGRSVTLVFEKAGEVSIDLDVRARGHGGTHGHGMKHNDSNGMHMKSDEKGMSN